MNPNKKVKELTEEDIKAMEENRLKYRTSPYPLIIQLKKSKSRSARKLKQKRKMAYAIASADPNQ